MPCDWKAALRQLTSLIQHVSEDWNSGSRSFTPHFDGAIGRQKRAPSVTPPPWLSRRNKRPAQRGGPRT
ncbi:hypothetical protein Pan97_29600 [Bremerella volcania]|uniref:Uncharacterized protein n=1 Tax=Bremerella volcania TaxID=2527984 RepID=A0A518C9K9_9BACT|nr:hypothetical protein [Bremerella volcania]QDU75916.1 hypothetical protein Pan97_29600 [Bremerella volcania]